MTRYVSKPTPNMVKVIGCFTGPILFLLATCALVTLAQFCLAGGLAGTFFSDDPTSGLNYAISVLPLNTILSFICPVVGLIAGGVAGPFLAEWFFNWLYQSSESVEQPGSAPQPNTTGKPHRVRRTSARYSNAQVALISGGSVVICFGLCCLALVVYPALRGTPPPLLTAQALTEAAPQAAATPPPGIFPTAFSFTPEATFIESGSSILATMSALSTESAEVMMTTAATSP